MKAPFEERRVRTPIVLQMEATECGAASLAIILGYHRRIVPLATLRRDCGVSRDGSKASNICKAGKAYGLIAKAFKKELSRLKDLRFPYIIFWNFNHFLVVEGFHKGHVLLNDPAAGRRAVTLEEFDRAYTGVVLVMEPGPDFKTGGSKPSLISAIFSRVRGSGGALAAAAFCALLLVIPGLAIPALISTFVDNVLVRGFQDWGRPLALGLILSTVCRTFLTALELNILGRLQLKLAVLHSARFVWHLLHLPASYYGQRYAGEVSSRIALNDKVAEVLSGKLATSVIDVLMMVFFLLVMIRFSPFLAALAFVFAALNFLVLQWIARKRLEGTYELALHFGKTAGFGIAGIQSIRTLKASALESDFFSRWAGFFANLTGSIQELALSNHVLGVFPSFLSGLMTLSILTAGSFRVMHGEFTIGQLVAFQSLALSFLQPVNNLVGLAARIQELEGDLSRLDDVLESPSIAEPVTPAQLETVKLRGHLEFRNVSFGYSPILPPLIEDLSFTLRPGHRLAIVGPSGSGKSTVAKLAAGLFIPTAGEILYDDLPASQVPHDVMTNSLAMIEQDISMFRGSVEENITLWNPALPHETIVEACTDAAIDNVVRAFPDGYHSNLLEGAANLSGGQRQRLEIARALVNSPSILIMDEATSALDTENERIVDHNIRRRGCACLIIAHRLSAIRDCEEIIVLQNGKTVERGTHGSLLSLGGLYWRLVTGEESPTGETASDNPITVGAA